MEFRFKQFVVKQSLNVFKIGTDSVLLGAWVDVVDAKNIFEIGTGTGVIALMMAQKSNASITAIDIQEDSVALANDNFSLSPWKNQLQALHSDFLNFSENKKFDLIVSNPPYFENALKSDNTSKMMARHLDFLPLDKMATQIANLLTEKGLFSVILPPDSFQKLENELKKHQLFLNRLCEVSSFENSQIIRCLGTFSRENGLKEISRMFLYKNKERERSDDYQRITKDFYL